MMKIFYYGLDDKVWHGPVAEYDAQSWYTSGYLFSDVQFQISRSDKFDPNGPVHTLGELIELNGRSLPFYFSPERTNRESDLEEKLIKLTEEVQSLRESVKKNQGFAESDKANLEYDMDALRTQIADLVDTQEDLIRQLSVSGEKEKSPIPPELETKVSNLKRKVEEQEKCFASMKKELSGLNSKCDRNDSKLDKLMASQNVMEGSVNGFDKRITELKASEKSIRESLSACKENFASNSTELTSIQSELSEIKNAMVKGKERSAEFRKVMDKTKEDIDSAWTTIDEHTERLNDVKQTEERLEREIENVKEASQKAIQMQSKSTVVDPESKEKSDVPPWEKPRNESPSPKDVVAEVKKIEDVKEMKKEESCPWDETKVDNEDVKEVKREERMPWEEDKTFDAEAKENKEVKKTEDVKEVKKEEGKPWDEEKITVDIDEEEIKYSDEVKEAEDVEELKEEESCPWDEDKAKVNNEVKKTEDVEELKEEESCPWDEDKIIVGSEVKSKTSEETQKEERSPWEEDKTGVDAKVKKSKASEEMQKVERSPWEEDKTKVDAKVNKSKSSEGVKKKEIAPWDVNEGKFDSEVNKERCPWESDESPPESEPWNRMSGSSKKDSVEIKKAVNGLSIDKVQRVKDWNKICLDLSDDEDSGVTPSATAVREQAARDSENFVRDFIALLRMYCHALDSVDFAFLKLDNVNLAGMDAYVASYDSSANITYGWIRDALKEEVRRLASTRILCHACNFNITTPRHLLYHFADSVHATNVATVPLPFRVAFIVANRTVFSALYRFILPQDEITESMGREVALADRGRQRARSGRHDLTRLRPTPQFVNEFAAKILIAVSTNLQRQFPAGAHSMSTKEMDVNARDWFADPVNRQKMDAELREHIGQGIPYCSVCAATFESLDEYYQHMTSYNHAMIDSSLFSVNLRLFKGLEYWDANL